MFTARYDTTRADRNGAFPAGSLTTIATPSAQYPGGYSVTVEGAHVVSAPNAPVLELASDPGAPAVEVSVARR